MDNPKKISWMAFIILIGFSLSVFLHYILGMYGGRQYPFNTFLFRPIDHWMDFVWLIRSVPDPYSVARADFQHFPFLYLVGDLLVMLGGVATIAPFLILSITFFSFTCLWNIKNTLNSSYYSYWFIFSFLSYPFLFAVDRGNLEFLIYILLYLFIFSRSTVYYRPILLGIAIAIKITAAVFIVYQISQKRFKEAFFSLAIAGLLTLLGYSLMPGTIVENVNNHLHNLNLYTQTYVIGNEGLFFGNSLFGAIKFILLWANSSGNITPSILQGLMRPYTLFTLIAFGGMTLYIFFEEKQDWKIIALLVSTMILFPYTSGDYKLLHLFLPVLLFIKVPIPDRLDRVYAIILGLLLIPKNFYNLPNLPEANIAIILNPILILLLCILIIYQGMSNFQIPQGGLSSWLKNPKA